MRRFAVVVLTWLCFSALTSQAQTIDVPQALQPWQRWVLHGEEFRRCPMQPAASAEKSDGFACTWPGRLGIAASASGGEFTQHWRVYADGWVTLPGDETHWPEDVRVNGRAEPATDQRGVPRLRLNAGEYTISGRFTWSRRPESLQLPPSTALVDLSIDSKPISPVELRDDRMWLGAVRTVAAPRGLQVQVYRLLEDDIPLQLTTRMYLKVSGDAREELLAQPLPDGFVPMAANGRLPMRFEPDGRLRVQVRSGEHLLTIVARASSAANGIAVPTTEGTWAEEEIWSYRSNDRLRITAIEGAPPIDPTQAGVPEEWRLQPAFRLGRGSTITIAERSRGLNSADSNRLSLQRDLWLAFDRTSFVATDRISGSMQQLWRLDMQSPYRLLNARRDEEVLLITDGADGRTGIEVRTPSLQVTTLARVDAGGAQPATGWDTRFESVFTTLHLPPGHRLLAAWGVDDAPDAWLSQWRLLDLFVLMLATAVAFRLLGWAGAAMAAAVIALTHGESNAPAWLWINLLVAIAAVRALPASRLRKWVGGYLTLSLATLVLVLIPFAISQYRLAIHPQLATTVEAPPSYPAMMSIDAALVPSADLAMDAAAPAGEVEPKVRNEAMRAVAETPFAMATVQSLNRYAPGAMLQTGPGIPDWRYLSYRLQWHGPVDVQQTVRLTILSPFWLSLWRIVGVVLSGVLVLLLVRLAYGVPRTWRLPPMQAVGSGAAVALLLMLGTGPRSEAQAPDPELLTELKKRLVEPAKCAPDCTQVVIATVDIAGNRLEVSMEAHAQANVALGIPQAGPQWVIDQVVVDERPTDSFMREGQRLQIPLTPGVHSVRIIGRVAQADELSLEFPQPPRRIAIRTQGWDSSGTSEGRLLNNSLQLTRRTDSTLDKTSTPQRFAPFVRIQRRLVMNLDWTVSTTIERLAPEDGAFTLRLPLLPGESVLTPGLEVRESSVLVSMPAGQQVAGWESSLDQVDRLRWTAALDQPWVETWEIIVSPMWHTEFAGTPAIMPPADVDGVWVHHFLPLPGESLDLTMRRPVASTGTTLAVDSVDFTTSFGQRLSNTTLHFRYRSSQGGRHDVRLPKEARVDSVTTDGNPLPLRPTDGMLPLTLSPGLHDVVISFSSDEGIGLASRPPDIDLGVAGTNVRTTLDVPTDRWVLFTWGRGVGPAILYWGELLLFAVVAILLGRLRWTPLRTRDWLFLGLGLSTLSWWVLLVFGVWLFLLERRSEWSIETRWRFNVVQVVLAVVSIAAIGVLIAAIPYGLLGQPDMGLRSVSMPAALSWFLDGSTPQLPRPVVISVSLWFYKLAMLLWALWLSFALLRWLPWAWRHYSVHGWWRGRQVAAA